MEHPDLAQPAAVIAAAGAALLLAGRGRMQLLAALVLLAIGEGGLVLATFDTGRISDLGPAAAGAAALLGGGAIVAVAALFVRRPAWVPLAVLIAAPLRPPLAFETGGGFPLTVAEDGRLGRLLPLYLVLAGAALALAWRAARKEPGAGRALPAPVAIPAAAFIAYACLSILWADELEPAAELLTFFTVPFALLAGLVARSPFPDWAPRAMGALAIALGVVFAVVGLYQAITGELFFFAPNLAVSNANTDYFRVTSLFGDPSLYGRHVVLAMGVLLVALALRRIHLLAGVVLLAVMWAGLFFSYSQSSFVALVVITVGLAIATGGPRLRRVLVGGLAIAAVAAVGYLASIELSERSLRQETSDRTQRVEDTMRVVEEKPIFGVGIGGQAQASRRLSDRDRPTPVFVSHTTPLTVLAELGAIGLVLYIALLGGGAVAIAAVRRLDPALGLALAASLLALFTHALFYSGFLEDPLTWLVLAIGAGYLGWPRRDSGEGAGAQRDAAAAAG